MLSENQKLQNLAEKVLEETIIVDGKGSKEWALKAVKAMTRVTRKYDAFETFYDAIMGNGSGSKCCIVKNEKLPGSFGRIQIFAQRCFRYPWIRFFTQIVPIKLCQNECNGNSGNVCINPWHYKSTSVPKFHLPPIIIDKGLDLAPYTTNDIPEIEDRIPNITMRGDEIRQLFDEIAVIDGRKTTKTREVESPNSAEEVTPTQYVSGLSSPASIISPKFYDNEICMDTLDEEIIDMEDEEGKLVKKEAPSENFPMYYNAVGHLYGMVKGGIGPFEVVEFLPCSSWMTLSYFEETNVLCEPYEVGNSHFLIDGFTTASPNTDRFSLGYYNNPGRSCASHETRSLIGRGIRFYYLGNGMYVESMCDVPIFIQSVASNIDRGFHPSTVQKILPNCTVKIFDTTRFAKQLHEATEISYQDVYALSRMCTLRIAFVKGWGKRYRRSSVMRSPCWIQVHLNEPLIWIDRILNCIGNPALACSSRT